MKAPNWLVPNANLGESFDMASMGKIDSAHTMRLLWQALVTIATAEAVAIPRDRSAMDAAQAYRAAKDPEVHEPTVSGPSKHRGIALARALGLLAAYEIMRPHLEAMRRARIAADGMTSLLAEFCAANEELRRLGQRHTPLFEAQEQARQLSLTLAAAHLQMPPSFSCASDAEQEEALLMNVTHCLSVAFSTVEIARLIDDRGGEAMSAKRARVRTRKLALGRWQGPHSEAWFIPMTPGLPGEEMPAHHSASSE